MLGKYVILIINFINYLKYFFQYIIHNKYCDMTYVPIIYVLIIYTLLQWRRREFSLRGRGYIYSIYPKKLANV